MASGGDGEEAEEGISNHLNSKRVHSQEKFRTTAGWATHWVIQAVDSGYPYTQPVPSLNITTFSDQKKKRVTGIT